MTNSLSDQALRCLLQTVPSAKCSDATRLQMDWLDGRLTPPDPLEPVRTIDIPGRPDHPALVPPDAVGRHSIHTRKGHAALIHALTHIEFNAINLALDAVYRFRGLPCDYYNDWLQVAAEEAQHFLLLREHLRSLGFDYGDFPAHDGLWQMCTRTAHDPLVRMALVPRLLEARGLDASPAIVRKLTAINDHQGAEILGIILRDEIGHVRIGNRWYEYLCNLRQLDPPAEFRRLLKFYAAPYPRPPLHGEARRAAGFSEEELQFLEFGADR